jgi:glycosyltransferase involved in cell wall biosynthesis
VGRGEQRNAIEAAIARLGLGDRVQLLGLRRDVPRLLAASDVFASAAAWEGMPVAVLEAMAAGLPIVATAVGDVPRVVDESCGTLVPPGRPDQLGAALDRVLADSGLRIRQGEAGRRRVARHFGAHAWSSRLIELYREMCQHDDASEGPLRKEDSCASPW